MFPTIDWSLIKLECAITGSLVLMVILDVLLPKDTKKDWIGTLSTIALFGLGGFWLTQGSLAGFTFNGHFKVDGLAWFFKAFFIVTMACIFPMTSQFFKNTGERRNEFYLLLWLALLGMCFTASAADFLVLFIAIEILTIAMYVMTAYLKSNDLSLEAGMKYLVLGSLAAGFLLFGISFIYGVTHTTQFAGINAYVSAHPMNPIMLFGLVLIIAGIGSKIAMVPFHLWVPDVYQGAPTPVTALLSVGSKAAGFVVLIRLFYEIIPGWHMQWSHMIAFLAAITMCYGNLGAIFQKNIKRMLGYSSIAHAGYLLLGISAGSALGLSGMNYYLAGYLVTSLAAFLVIILFSVIAKSDNIDDYTGLALRSPLLGATLILALASLAGMPPLAGFFGKFTLLMATVQSGYLWLALVAAVNIVISLYYYLNVARKLYSAPHGHLPAIQIPGSMQLMLALLIIAIIVVGIFQGPFMNAAIAASKSVF